MLAFFSTFVVRAIVFLAASLCVQTQGTESTKERSTLPLVRIVVPAQKDTADAEGAKETKSAKDAKPSEGEKKKKSVSISITDKGLKVGADDEHEVILEFDADQILKDVDELKRLGELKAIPESILARFDDEDARRFYDVRGKDLVKFGETVIIDENELIRGNVVSIFGDIEIEGKVIGDVVAVMGDIDLGPTAIVNGEVVSVLGRLDRHDDARVRGETMIVGGGTVPFNLRAPFFGRNLLFGAVSRIILFIIGILLLGIVMAFLGDRMTRSSTHVFGSFFKSLGIGALVLFVGAIVVAIIAVIFSITIIGIPVALLIVFSFAALCILGYFVSSIALGRILCAKCGIETDSPFVHGLIGLLLLSILGILGSLLFFNPFVTPLRYLFRTIGGFVQLVALLTGIGAFIISKAGSKTIEAKPALPE